MKGNITKEADSCGHDLVEKASTNLALNGGHDRKIYAFAYVGGGPFFKYYCVPGACIISFTISHHLISTKACVVKAGATFRGFYHILVIGVL